MAARCWRKYNFLNTFYRQNLKTRFSTKTLSDALGLPESLPISENFEFRSESSHPSNQNIASNALLKCNLNNQTQSGVKLKVKAEADAEQLSLQPTPSFTNIGSSSSLIAASRPASTRSIGCSRRDYSTGTTTNNNLLDNRTQSHTGGATGTVNIGTTANINSATHLLNSDFNFPNNSSVKISENDPLKHTTHHLFKFFNISEDIAQMLQISLILRQEFVARMKALHENSIMLRSPGLECIEILRASCNPESIATKIVLYGDDGCGKSSTLVNVLHTCYQMNWMVICPVRHYLWNKYFSEVTISSRKSGRIDIPKEGVDFLMSIKQMNSQVFQKFGDSLRTVEAYTWSKKEATSAGSTIEELLDFGIERPKYSCDVAGAFLKEVRLNGKNWPMPVFIALDGVNSFFAPTKIFTDRVKRISLPASQISLVHNLLKLISQPWHNGGMLLVADERANPLDKRASCQPRYLLGEEGFNMANPFIPIHVENYNHQEINNTLDYLIERKWIQNQHYRTSKEARKELIFLSDHNPLFLENVLKAV